MKKKLVTLLLGSALIGAYHIRSLPAQPANPDLDSPKLVDCNASLVIGGLVLVIGAAVYFGLKGFCEKHLPPEPPPPPPPPNNCTNCNPAHPTWPCTNCPPSTSSLPKSLVQLKSLQLESGGAVDYSDIISQGWLDPFGNRFCVFFSTKFQTSTNLLNWSTELGIEGYVSFKDSSMRWPSNSIMIVRSNGIALYTNWSWVPSEPFLIPIPPAPQRLYRLAHD